MYMITKKDTQKHSRLRRYRRLNMSHFLLLGAVGGGGGGGGVRTVP